MARRFWPGAALVALLSAPIFFFAPGEREVADHIEERVAVTAREMWRAGEWVLPTMNGELRLQKPPLAYWLAEVAASVRGTFDDGTLRLPFAILAVGTLLFTCGIGRLILRPDQPPRLGPDEEPGGLEGGLLAGIVLLTTFLFTTSGHMASPDGPLLFATAGSWYFHLLARDRHARGLKPGWARVGSYFFLGLGALAKGPVILAVTVLPILVEAAAARSLEPLRALASAPGAALFLCSSLIWPVLVILRLSPGSGGVSPIEQWFHECFGKILPAAAAQDLYQHHPEPWYYYLLRLSGYFGIWALPLLLAVAADLRTCCRRLSRAWLPSAPSAAGAGSAAGVNGGSPLAMVPVIWFMVVLVLFSFVAEKKAMYLLPLLPAGAVMIARFIEVHYARCRLPLRVACLISGAAAVVVAAAAAAAALHPPLLDGSFLDGAAPFLKEPARREITTLLLRHPAETLLLAGIVAAGAGVTWRLLGGGRARMPLLALAGTAAMALVPFTALYHAFLMGHEGSIREDFGKLARSLPGDKPLHGFGLLPAGVLYYLDRRVAPVGYHEAAKLQSLPAGSLLLVGAKALQLHLRPGCMECLERAMGGGSVRPVFKEGPLQGFVLLGAVNPETRRDKERVLLLEKQS